MDERLIISMNWVLGTLGLLVAVLFPILDDKFLTGMKKKATTQIVARIAQAQNESYTVSEKYHLFGVGEMPPEMQSRIGVDLVQERDFVYDAFMEGKTLVIRAQAAPSAIISGALPPLVYVYKKPPNGKVTRQWVPLSGKKPGLIPGGLI
jgi:hypothetical protein